MARKVELSFEHLKDVVDDLAEEYLIPALEEIEEQNEELLEKIEEQYKMGKIPINVGYEDLWYYVGVFCNEESISLEQKNIIEKLNRKILSLLDKMFYKCTKLTCSYNALKKELPVLNDEDLKIIENVHKKIVLRSKANYLAEHALMRELKHIYQLKKGSEYKNVQINSNPFECEIYDFTYLEIEYRKRYFVYRCYKVIEEWQKEILPTHLGYNCKEKDEFITKKDLSEVEERLYEYRTLAKKNATSELVRIVIEADTAGEVDMKRVEQIYQIFNEKIF